MAIFLRFHRGLVSFLAAFLLISSALYLHHLVTLPADGSWKTRTAKGARVQHAMPAKPGKDPFHHVGPGEEEEQMAKLGFTVSHEPIGTRTPPPLHPHSLANAPTITLPGKAAKTTQTANPSIVSIGIAQDRNSTRTKIQATPDNAANLTTAIVVGRLKDEPESVGWLDDVLVDMTHKYVYVVDDPSAPLHLKKNKGREAMVYVRYILDHYDELADITIFFHASRDAWHNNMLTKRDGAIMVNNLRRQHVLDVGYFNMRCELHPGCDHWIKFDPSHEEVLHHFDRNMDLFTPELWDRLFPDRGGADGGPNQMPVSYPHYLSQPCCSQFAVSRETIREVPLKTWERIHDWLGTTTTLDGYTGRIMEYIWQYLFLGEEELCLDMDTCYCKGYGICLPREARPLLEEYNEKRFQEDEVLSQLGDWDKKEGCDDIEDKQKKDHCKQSNPYNKVIGTVRARKAQLEDEMPGLYGVTAP